MARDSGGSVEVEIYPNDELWGGSTNEAVRMISEGAVDLAGYVSGSMSLLDPRLEVATIPWAFSGYREARRVIDESGGRYYEMVLAQHGLVYLGSTHNGMRQLTNNLHPVRRPEDLADMRIRVLGGESYRLFFSALGARPIPLSWSALAPAIRQGDVDGQENGFFVMRSRHIDEIQKYMTLYNAAYENYIFVISRKSYDELEPSVRVLIREKMREACEWSRDLLEAEEAGLRAEFAAAGMEIIEPTPEELAAFRDSTARVREELKAKYGPEACAAFRIDMPKD